MSMQAKKRLPFDATPAHIEQLNQRARAAGMTRQAYMEQVLFGEVISDARFKGNRAVDIDQEGLPMTG